jgi:adenylate kinase
MNIIFIAGIHGVGKTTVSQVMSKKLGIPHLSASNVIKEEHSFAVNETSKLVANVKGNQQLLINGLKKAAHNHWILLDGHFTMRRKSDGELENVPIETFIDINVSAIVLYIDSPSDISDRLFIRDQIRQSKELLHLYQETEIAHAQYVAATLGVPLIKLPPCEVETAISQIKTWFEYAVFCTPSHLNRSVASTCPP